MEVLLGFWQGGTAGWLCCSGKMDGRWMDEGVETGW